MPREVSPSDASHTANAIVVVPCFDEAERLDGEAFEAFLRAHTDLAFLFVDDGSSDRTLERLRALEAALPGRVRVEALPDNRGKAEAVRCGVLRAFALGPSCVGYWDADLATPLEAIPRFLAVLDERPGVDLVMGARVVLLGRRVERRPARHYVGRIAATAISLLLGLRVYDTQCGAKLFRATAEAKALFEEPFVASWLFDVELLARWIRARGGRGGDVGERIYELPLERWRDVAGSKLRPRDYLRAMIDLIRIERRYLARAAPRRER